MTFPNTHPRWSYARLEDDLVVAVAEKQPISRHATAGLYYFRRGVDFVRGAERMLFKNASFGGEFYVAPVYNELILAGKRVGVFPIDAVADARPRHARGSRALPGPALRRRELTTSHHAEHRPSDRRPGQPLRCCGLRAAEAADPGSRRCR